MVAKLAFDHLDAAGRPWASAVRSHSEKADRLFDAGMLVEALREYDSALKLQPDDAYLLNNRGATLARLDRKADALADFERAVELEPLHPNFLRHKAFVLAEMGRFAEALTALKLEHPIVKEAREIVLHRHLRSLVKSGFASWSGGKPKGSEPPIEITPGPPVSDYVIEDRRWFCTQTAALS